MDELVHQLLTILRGMWHRRWIGLAAAWIAAIVGVTVALRIPDRYEATRAGLSSTRRRCCGR